MTFPALLIFSPLLGFGTFYIAQGFDGGGINVDEIVVVDPFQVRVVVDRTNPNSVLVFLNCPFASYTYVV